MQDAKTITIRGVTYDIQDLVSQRERNKENINLRTGHRTSREFRKTKYSVDDRIWQAQATLSELQERYNLTEIQARAMSWQARSVLTRLNIMYARR